jgi:hypothetical protein
MEVIIYTVCSLNHLAQAKTLCDSVLRHNPGYHCVIGLADRINGRINRNAYAPFRIIEGAELGTPEFEQMTDQYNVLELNCALKSFFGRYILQTMKPRKMIFLDSDMLVFQPLHFLEQQLEPYSILITPHITRPFPDEEKRPRERDILKTGMYNAGFIAFRNDEETDRFFSWWTERMANQCYERIAEGLNADQNWLNFVPLVFRKVSILRHAGCNAAYWNLHERTITKRGNEFYANEDPLLFFHYSGFSLLQPDQISRHQDRVKMEDQPALKELFGLYAHALQQAGHAAMLAQPNAYAKQSIGKRIRKMLKG